MNEVAKWYPSHKSPEKMGRVENSEKAERMALVEKAFRNFSALYKEYLQDPEAYISKYGDTQDRTPYFREINEFRVKPEDIVDDAIIKAEIEGELFDYEEELSGKSKLQLVGEIIKNSLRGQGQMKKGRGHLVWGQYFSTEQKERNLEHQRRLAIGKEELALEALRRSGSQEE